MDPRPEGTPQPRYPASRPIAPTLRTRGALLGFGSKFLEQVLATGDRRAVQASGATWKKPGMTAAKHRPEPRAEPQTPLNHNTHGRERTPGPGDVQRVTWGGATYAGRGLEDR